MSGRLFFIGTDGILVDEIGEKGSILSHNFSILFLLHIHFH